jgi:hypothetical protein
MTSRLYCERMVRRPRAATIISSFLFAATVIAAIVGYALLFPGELLGWLSQFNKPGIYAFEELGRRAGLLLLMLACGTAAAAIGLLRARKWAWWFAVVLFAVNGCGDLLSFFITRDALRSGSGVLICAMFLFALSKVKSYFNGGRGGREEL